MTNHTTTPPPLPDDVESDRDLVYGVLTEYLDNLADDVKDRDLDRVAALLSPDDIEVLDHDKQVIARLTWLLGTSFEVEVP